MKFVFRSRHKNYKDETVIVDSLREAIEWIEQKHYFREPFWEESEFVNKCRVCYTSEDAEEVAYDVSW
ncbi:hypothetical protein [Paenibacillus naphthalenovorans]|uniref:Uncharacterized protein n=1 Tax=Paenibacillus naphthalenovorans TaxID=162209 RepID=A0A0U2U7A7_9BACL|nr:hypothetical protein [Paenibacillus naphthalenovorans]ALS22249.1 hypothetical protein IJ22_18750 [Paenibacillus naphthalenovorans]